uniref:Mannan endo-1,4-beta-mannosidase n=1 Tax=Chenopodium quinoa TaxID=63459 RepID=A0A803NE05_CHEQI
MKIGAKFAFLCSLLVGICCIQSLIIGCQAGRVVSKLSINPVLKVKAVNLGGWLLTEGWIKPSLFDGIPNKDLLDGTQIQLKSVTIGKYVCAENGGGNILVANRISASGWETFKLWRIDENTFNFRVFSNQFAGVQAGGGSPTVVTVASTPGASETFKIVRNPNDKNRVRIQAPSGLFLQAKTQDQVTADYAGDGGWGDDNPSVFVMTIVATLQGEFQVTNGYGPDKAPEVMREHWNTFIVEDDFRFISQNGLNAVRIPVGWWIASDPTPPKPFVGGSLQALDNAFTWAQKYGIQVIVDLHAAPGSQNGNEHSGTRDGSLEWGKTDATVQQSVAVIDFLASRYAQKSNLLAIELINEPVAPAVTLDTLKSYYQQGYDTVRKYSSSAYVIMSNRLGPIDARELFPLASGKQLTVVDVHYYNLFSSIFDNMSVQQNIDFINNNRSSDLGYITTSDGPLTFVGEWVAEWQVNGATKEDFQNFANAQLQVYGRATFGWAYWTYKNVNNHWSLQWMIQNGEWVAEWEVNGATKVDYINFANAQLQVYGFKVKAVNLGGWLVTEGWIKPSLFDGIPNKELLDGTQIQLKSVTIGNYVCAENGGGSILVANRTSASGWETFKTELIKFSSVIRARYMKSLRFYKLLLQTKEGIWVQASNPKRAAQATSLAGRGVCRAQSSEHHSSARNCWANDGTLIRFAIDIFITSFS